jgi:hypothetical protein
MVFVLLALGALSGCSGDDERPPGSQVRNEATSITASRTPSRFQFVDALRALRDPDPTRRLAAIEWLGRRHAATNSLARDALRAAVADDSAEVAATARRLLEALGENVPR